MPTLPTYTATRYVEPLREGGSMPAIVETGDGLYVAKFRGAGQGAKVLVAEIIVGLLAREIGLPVPEIARIEVPPPFGQSEPDPEIQDILRGSRGTNIGLRYLDGAFNYDDLAAGDRITPEFAADLVWFDAYVTNPDRTARNPNILIWEGRPWLIDHGAALYAHHDWSSVDESRIRTPFPLIRDHVLLGRSGDIEAADERLAERITGDRIEAVTAAVPDALLMDPIARGDLRSAADARRHYREYLTARLEAPRAFVRQAVDAKAQRLREGAHRLSARR